MKENVLRNNGVNPSIIDVVNAEGKDDGK